jgi:hypothetical protein
LSTPFGGTAATVPGIVEAEKFDEGGAEVAYHDNDRGNNGGEYRNTDVDLEVAADTGGGYDVGWMDATEWMTYSINVTASGTYSIEARLASAMPGGTFHLEINGVPVTGPITVLFTGGWQNWQSVTVNGVSLSAGAQRLRIVVDTLGSTGGFGNINFLRFIRTGA